MILASLVRVWASRDTTLSRTISRAVWEQLCCRRVNVTYVKGRLRHRHGSRHLIRLTQPSLFPTGINPAMKHGIWPANALHIKNTSNGSLLLLHGCASNEGEQQSVTKSCRLIRSIIALSGHTLCDCRSLKPDLKKKKITSKIITRAFDEGTY